MNMNQKLITLLCVGLLFLAILCELPTSAKTTQESFNLEASAIGGYVQLNRDGDFRSKAVQQLTPKGEAYRTSLAVVGTQDNLKLFRHLGATRNGNANPGRQRVFGENKFAFYKENNLYTSSTEGESSLLGADIKIKQNKKFITSKRFTYSAMPKDVLNNMKFSEGMGFYSALQSADENTWLFVERNMENTSYNLCLYDSEKNKEIIFSQDTSPDPNYAFMPIAWSKSKDVVYLEALIFGSATENEGIWSYNIVTKQSSRLSISPSYLTTPVISPDGEYFVYGGTTDPYKGLHSAMNIVFVYDIKNERERVVAKDNNSWFSISGWVDNNIDKSDVVNINETESSPEKKSNDSPMQPAFELPWNSGVTYYVSRAGTPAPSGPIGSSCFLNIGFGPHTYVATDFDSPNGVYDPVRASAAGTVIYAQFNTGGYGNLVKIRHADNTITYYAHLNTISVSVNDVVQQGCEIGDGGTTGNSTGDHIHFEWRDTNDVRMSTYPTFNECGCQPHANYCYTSNNNAGTCSGSTCLSGTATLRNRDNGPPIHPPSSVIKVASASTVYLIDPDNRKRPITSSSVLAQLYNQSTDPRTGTNFTDWVITVAQDELDLYETGGNISAAQPGNGMPFPDGKLIGFNGQVSIVTGGGKRRPFTDGGRFTGLGFNFCQVVNVSQSEYNSYPLGPPVDAMPLLTSSVSLFPSGPYTVGQNITGSFTIKNVGYESITFSNLGIGGRFNGANVFDLGFVSTTLSAGSSYPFGSPARQLTSAGTYDFFAAYQENNGHWAISVPAAPGVIRSRQIQVSNPTPRTLTVASSNPSSGVNITVSPNDNNGQGNGTTQFTRTYNNNTGVNLTAPATASGNNFQKWQRNGSDWSTSTFTTVTMDANHTMTAVYTTPVVTRTLTVASSNPSSGVNITVSPNDNNGQGNGITQFTRTYNNNTGVNLTAPATASGNNFQKWQRDGSDWSMSTSATVTMDANHTMTAVYTTPVVTRTLTVASSNPGSGVSITVSPNDNNGQGSGTTQFTRVYNNNTNMSLTAPSTAGANNFQKWQLDGVDLTTSLLANFVMDANHTMTAVYVSTPPPTRTLTVASSSPSSGVSITVSPNDNNGQGSGTTQFTRVYNNNANVNLTAPPTAGGNNFQKWQRDGADWSTNTSTNVTMDANYAMTAVYTNGGSGGNAIYDSVLKAPKCGSPGNFCDSGTLLNGRDSLAGGSEPNQPNTINTSCADGTGGGYHVDESVDAIKISTLDGSNFAPGKTVRIEVTAWVFSVFADDHLDLYYAGDATNPNWIYIGTLEPSAAGSQVLSTTYTLPSGGLQAVRARFRYQGVVASCGTNGSYDDHDDLIFSTTPSTSSTNFALASNGGIASASTTTPNSQFPGYNFLPSVTIDGNRRSGVNFWRDDTANTYPDWLQVDFNGSKSITEIDVFTIQDNDQNPSDPTQAMIFSLNGITAFDVQYWTGSAWATVPNGSVTGNDKVWRQFTFSPITTSKVRVLVNNALNSRSRIVEMEAWDVAPVNNINYALATNGAVASASSTTPNNQFPGYNFLPSVTIDGNRRSGVNFWRDDTANAYPDWLQVDFNGSKSITEIDVFTIQDNDQNPSDPTLGMTFSLNGITAFDVQYWTGSAWATVPNGSVTGNDKVWRQFTFSPITTSKVRVLVNNALNSRSRIVEVEAWSTASSSPNHALATNGGLASASSTTPNNQFPGYDFLPSVTIDGNRRSGVNFWRDDTANAYPDWLQVDFNGSKSITEIDVFTIQDNDQNPSDPTLATTFSLNGITAFDVQYWTGSAWATVPNGSVTGNDKVWRQFTFSPITTNKVRVLVNNALNSRSRIVEVEAY